MRALIKQIIWLGDTHRIIRGYPDNIKQEIGYNLDKLQRGLDPHDWKPITSVGSGVKEIRIHDANEYRILYVAKFEESIYILHSFIKKTTKTLTKDIKLAQQRYAEMIILRRIKK